LIKAFACSRIDGKLIDESTIEENHFAASQLFKGRRFFARLLLAFGHKTPFWVNSFHPCFCEVSVTGHDGGVSRDFEPLGPFEPFWRRYSVRCVLRTSPVCFSESAKNPRMVAQKTRPGRMNFRACFCSSRVLRRLCMEAATWTRNGAKDSGVEHNPTVIGPNSLPAT